MSTEDQTVDIHKAAGVIIRERKLLVCHGKGKDTFVSPGGKIEEGETPKQALIRELKEELRLDVGEEELEPFGTFYAWSAGAENVGKRICMEVFMVTTVVSDITPDNEIDEIRWVTSELPKEFALGSIFAHEVIPKLKEMNLID
jgi:8-oxo-dGTP pyrophosphatase MutT (NUDIX family)